MWGKATTTADGDKVRKSDYVVIDIRADSTSGAGKSNAPSLAGFTPKEEETDGVHK
jgi:hypothetical protein